MIALPMPATRSYDDERLAAIRLDAELLERALVQRRIDAGDPHPRPALLVAEIDHGLHEADATPGGLSGLLVDDYCRDPAAFCDRMRLALRWSCELHQATDLWPRLTAGLGAIRCAHTGCTSDRVELYGRLFWCPEHLADRLAEALLAETMGEGDDGA